MSIIENYKVEKAHTKIYGHIRSIELELIFSNFCVRINPKRSWFASTGINELGRETSYMPFYELFKVFDIDCEDGASFEKLTDKYCRVVFDDNYNIVQLMHITEDNIHVNIEDLR